MLLAIFFPVISVMMNRGSIGQILTSFLLTLLLWVPGVIYALKIRAANLEAVRLDEMHRTLLMRQLNQ